MDVASILPNALFVAVGLMFMVMGTTAVRSICKKHKNRELAFGLISLIMGWSIFVIGLVARWN